MELKETMCYSRLVYMMCQGEEWELAVNSVTFTQPMFSHEGMAGYIETKVTFQIANLTKFTELWDKWYQMEVDSRMKWYKIVNNNKCK